jgi:hypothetical protein
MKKKPWTKPALIALVRGKPEEAVLSGCKGIVQANPLVMYSNCIGDNDTQCFDCYTGGIS